MLITCRFCLFTIERLKNSVLIKERKLVCTIFSRFCVPPPTTQGGYLGIDIYEYHYILYIYLILLQTLHSLKQLLFDDYKISRFVPRFKILPHMADFKPPCSHGNYANHV